MTRTTEKYLEDLLYKYLFDRYDRCVSVSEVCDKLFSYKSVDNVAYRDMNSIVINAYERNGLGVDDDMKQEIQEEIDCFFNEAWEN